VDRAARTSRRPGAPVHFPGAIAVPLRPSDLLVSSAA